MSHTPKPWTTSINDVRHAGRTQLVYGPDQTPINQNGFICEVQAPIVGSEFDSKTRLDNARLIAAAPDLLEALEAAERLCKKALPEFNWGDSALSADAIQLLNEVPGQISAAIAQAGKEE